jgi:hypothetical protein
MKTDRGGHLDIVYADEKPETNITIRRGLENI